MSQKEFDDIIKNKLRSFALSEQKGDWTSFEKIMEADENFDEIIKTKLQQFEVPFDPKSWKPLARRIESEFGWLNKVFRFKLVEFSFLLLVTYFLNQAPQVIQSDKIITESLSTELSKIETRLESPFDSNTYNSVIAKNSISYSVVSPIPTRETLAKRTKVYEEIFNLNTIPPNREVRTETLEEEYSEKKINQSYPILKTSRIIEDAVNTVALNFFYGADANRIITPFDSENRFDKLDRFVFGYTIGATVDIQKPNYALQTGFAIANKHYSPRQVIYYAGSVKNGFFGKRLEDIELNILAIPLNLKKELITLRNWKISALAGLAWNVALNADYKVKFKSTSDISNYKSGNLDNLTNSIRGRQLNKGWLEGGGFKENSYLTANLGLTFEKSIGKNINWFVQPTYIHTTKSLGQGLGPDQDIINTFSLYSGITIQLGK